GIQLICQTDMDEDLIYKLTKTIIENLDCMAKVYAPAKALTPEFMATELGNPFHPGAIKYFKEKGLWK
ncbi:MAG: TAXI family TRAP transporter solute-binding subunit, partial [Deltaproteobacteria bacterium]